MISCGNFSVDDYLDGELDDACQAQFIRHLEGCGHCQARLALEKKRRVVMRALPTPRLHPDFAERCFENVHHQYQRQGRKRRLALLSAMAASLLVAVAVTLLGKPWSDASSLSPEVVVELNEIRDIRFSVTSSQAVVGARLHVRLPDNVELVGYPQMRELSWMADLHQGENRLSLPLKPALAGHGEVVMDIYAPSGKKIRKTIQLQTQLEDAVWLGQGRDPVS